MPARFIKYIICCALLGYCLFPNEVTASKRGVISVTLGTHDAIDAPHADTVVLYRRSFALVIGIDAYTNGWTPLANTVRDARKVKSALEQRGFEVSFYQNLNSVQLKDEFERFFTIKGADPDSRLFIWFAGHGHTIGDEGYLVPADAAPMENTALFRYKALSLRRFGEFARQASAKHTLAVFDSCFAGTIFHLQKSGAIPGAVTRSVAMPVRQYISSGDRRQEVPDDGVFCQLFLDALDGKNHADYNNDGYLTGTELGFFLHNEVTGRRGATQTPRYGKLYDYKEGDFIFILNTNGNIDIHSPAEQQPDIMPHRPGGPPVPRGIKAAIFPSRFETTQPGGVQKSAMVEAIISALSPSRGHSGIVAAYSHYSMPSGSAIDPLPSGLISFSEMQKIWKKPQLFASPEPNTELISQIASGLGISAVLLYQIVDQAGDDVIIVWLVDVKNKKRYEARDDANFNARSEALVSILQALHSQVFAEYIKGTKAK